MQKLRIFCGIVGICLIAAALLVNWHTLAAAADVNLIFTSWRTEDIEGTRRVLDVYMQAHPGVSVDFQPITDSEYDAQLMSSLQTGTGADIIFLRSFSSGRAVFNGGFLSVLNDEIPELANFPAAAMKAWSTEDGQIYGVPIFGVTHGVYYHKDIFAKYDLQPPATWDEFLKVCQTLKDNGENVFAQGAMDEWTLYEVLYSGLGANFYGGEKSRLALIAGEMKLTDAPFVDAFKAIDALQPFLPVGYEALDYVSMQQMFGAGQAAMFIGGSWEIGLFRSLGSTDLGWFAPPVKKAGEQLAYCFHVDAGIGVNKNSKHYAEALEFLKWTATPEFAQLMMKEVPGFFAYTPGEYTLDDELAKAMLDAADGADLTIRTTWEKLSDQAPSGNSLMNEALIKMLKDEFTPEQAAEFVQQGLATWYQPFQK
ncbi:extracellular solute-binding protein family 1 [Candidatus Vecturithrix granuli]|uniref:Probable sugar-binding periplasmic protein n=1 Tax=Vecturithrix granuli TaxID=1499967 RepID=A0A081BY85_VECG1|nr:extracellular solute-binding protein family 1 [Candidatus Vecturithrix granuli]